MSNTAKVIDRLKTEIVSVVQAIDNQMSDKKEMMASYNENIKALKANKDALMIELENAKEQLKQAALQEQADEIINASAQPGDDDLTLVV